MINLGELASRTWFKLLVQWLAIALALMLFSWYMEERDEQFCNTISQNTENLNQLIDTVIKRIDEQPDMTDEEKTQARELYEGAKGKVPAC